MQNKSVWALAALAGTTYVLGCTAGGSKEGTKPPNQNSGATSSTGGSGTGTGGSSLGGSLGGPPGLEIPPDGEGIDDPDPGNPNVVHPKCAKGTCKDFPEAPILGEGVPPNAAELFAASPDFTPGSLCMLEPQLSSEGKEGAMMPANWVRPRFRVAAPAEIDLLEIRLHSPMQKNDLVAYTLYSAKAGAPAPSWYLPKEIWAGPGGMDVPASGNGFANNSAGYPVTVTIRGINSKAPGKPVGVSGDFHIAPVVATGSMVFWTVNSSEVTLDSSKLLGFAVGDEGVAESLKLDQIKWAGQIGEDGSVLRGYYDDPKLPDFDLGQVRCIGCHTSLPDGSGVVFTDDWPWSKAAATLTAGSVGAIPTMISPGAQAIMKMPWWGTQSLSLGHWATGDRILLTTYGTTFEKGTARTKAWNGLPGSEDMNPANDEKLKWAELAWIDLETTAAIDVSTVPETPMWDAAKTAREDAAIAAKGTGWGIIATGDKGFGAASPSFNHKGDQIVYTATDYAPDGHPDALATMADLRTVPYNNKAGGTSQPLMGAADPAFLEYYPSYSADDALIAFTRAPAKSTASPDGPYYNRFGQISVIPAAGGTPIALAANDPGTCASDDPKVGQINSWPKWSPDAFVSKGKTYYFLVFSSGRKYGDDFSQQFQLPPNPLSSFKGLTASSQLYLAAVVVDNETKQITTYPAVYIWNQNRLAGTNGAAGLKYSNLTPAWDPIKLPPIEIPEVENEPPK